MAKFKKIKSHIIEENFDNFESDSSLPKLFFKITPKKTLLLALLSAIIMIITISVLVSIYL